MLPEKYSWLTRETAPKMLLEGLKTYGTLESPGHADNPTIINWAREVGVVGYYHDEQAWCGLWVALVARRAGKPIPERPLWALNWAKWGERSPTPGLGDVLVFERDGGGHVGLYVGEDVAAYHVLGGNQSDGVNIARKAKGRLRACRQFYAVGRPAGARRIVLSEAGELTTRED